MPAIVITKVVRETEQVSLGDHGRSIGQHVDEMIERSLFADTEIQSVAVELTQAEWENLRQSFGKPAIDKPSFPVKAKLPLKPSKFD